MKPYAVTALVAFLASVAAPVTAQTSLPPVPSGCKQPLPSPVAEPPAGSPPVFLFFEICKTMKITGASEQEQSDAYIQQIRVARFVSQPSRGRWTPYTTDVEQTVSSDLEGLRSRRSIESATSEVNDYVFPNGTVGKVVTYHVVEREQETAFLLQGAPRGYEQRGDSVEFRAFLAKGTDEKSGRCALPDGTARGVHSIITFRSGLAYRCVEEWVRVSGASPVRQVFERQVKWKAFHPVVPPEAATDSSPSVEKAG